MSDVLIQLDNVTMMYQNLIAVDHVSLSIEKGDFLVIAGENGSGKTTLMKGILGLKPLQSGKITYPGVTPNKIGYLPQVIEIQKDFPASVMEVVLSGDVNQLNNRVFYPKSFKEKAIRNLKLLEIDHLVNTSFRNLSGGQCAKSSISQSPLCYRKIFSS